MKKKITVTVEVPKTRTPMDIVLTLRHKKGGSMKSKKDYSRKSKHKHKLVD